MKGREHQPGGENDDPGHLSSPGESRGLEKPREAGEQLGVSPLEESRGGTIVFSAADNPALERQQDTAELEKLERRREYHRKYYQQNRERVLAQKRERYHQNPELAREKAREQKRKQYYQNPEPAREASLKWYQQNRERVLAQRRKWREQNRERTLERAAEKPSPTYREYQREYYLKNRERIRERKREYNRHKREAKGK
jgi:hypothetical protein